MLRHAIVALSIALMTTVAVSATPTSVAEAPVVKDSGANSQEVQATDAHVKELEKEIKQANASGKEPDTSVACTLNDQVCSPATLYVNGYVVSTIDLTKLPVGKPLTVRISSGEPTKDGTVPFVEKSYTSAPDVVTVAVTRQRRSRYTPAKPATDNNPTINFVTFGRSPAIKIQLSNDEIKTVTIRVQVVYQPWFVDTGGFMVFSTLADQELVTQASGDKTLVLKKRRKDRMTPATGAVLNLHPANIPTLALQFGLATNNNRQPSYFLGAGWRLREIGAKALLTTAVGLAAVPALRFRDIKVGDSRPSDDQALKGTTAYSFGPYVSLSFGFSFGDSAPPPPKPGQ